jgi:hypothetical protein
MESLRGIKARVDDLVAGIPPGPERIPHRISALPSVPDMDYRNT